MDRALEHSQRNGHHGGSGGGGGGGQRDGGNFKKRRYDDNPQRGGPGREWGDRRDHRGGRGDGRGEGRGGFDRRDGGDRGGRSGFDRRDGGGRGRGCGRFERHDGGGRGRGRGDRFDGRGRGPPRTELHDSSRPRAHSQGGQLSPEEMAERANKPVPQEERRTLILSNVPSHIRLQHVRDFFYRNWNAQVQYYLLDRNTGEAYVRFKFVEDARRVWEEGARGLDGGIKLGEEEVSLEGMGVTVKAVHFTNYIMDNRPPREDHGRGDQRGERGDGGGGGGFDRKRNWRDDGQDDRGGGGYPPQQDRGPGYGSGGRSGHIPHHSDPPSKMPRYSEEGCNNSRQNRPQSGGRADFQDYPGDSRWPDYEGYPDEHNPAVHDRKTPPSAGATVHSTPPTGPKKNTYVRSPSKQTPPMSEEDRRRREQFQKEESEWRARRQDEYDAFAEAKNERLSKIATLEQKRDLLLKQEEMCNKQLPLHMKMLEVLKAKSAPASDQSKKMKEILTAKTKVVELKKDMKDVVEEIEALKAEEQEKGAFKPSEKRPVFLAAGGGGGTPGGAAGQKRSLDRRTTVLRVEGFGDDVAEAAINEHFSTHGSVASVTLDIPDDEPRFALVTFANRADAERAKAGAATFNGVGLTCTWHNPSTSPSTPKDTAETTENVEESAPDVEENEYADEGLYADVGDDDQFGGDVFEEAAAAPPDDEEQVDYDYDEEEDLVDYD